MKNDAIALVDALAPPDYVLNSSLGDSSRNAHKKMYNSMIQSKESLESIPFLNDFHHPSKFGRLRN